jgi:hypothetical protein
MGDRVTLGGMEDRVMPRSVKAVEAVGRSVGWISSVFVFTGVDERCVTGLDPRERRS